MKTLENEAAQYEVQNDEYLTPYQVEQEPIVKDSIQINDNLEKTIKTPTILVKN